MGVRRSNPVARMCLPAILAGLAMLTATLAAAPQNALAQQACDGSLLQQLAERLLGTRGPTPMGNAVRVQLLPGALPADLPLDLPLPDGSTLIGSVVAPSFARTPTGPFPTGGPVASSPTGSVSDVVVDAPGAPPDILSFYQTALAALGWNPPSPNRQGQGGGFLPPFVPAYTASFCAGSVPAWLSVNVFPTSAGPNDLRLHIETGNLGPCFVPPGFPPFGPPPGADLLPPLHAPPGVPVLPSGGSGGLGRFASDAAATTTMSATDLETFYDRQLVDAGWTRMDGHDDGSLIWSTWSVPSSAAPNDWQGFLLVRDGPGDGQVSLHVEVASASLAGSGGASFPLTLTATVTPTAVAPAVAPPVGGK